MQMLKLDELQFLGEATCVLSEVLTFDSSFTCIFCLSIHHETELIDCFVVIHMLDMIPNGVKTSRYFSYLESILLIQLFLYL